MTVLETFLSFARRLPADRLAPVETVLSALMDTYDDAAAFSEDQLSELDRRLAEPKPTYAAPTAIDQLLGRKLNG